jgi:putative ATP-dependent endonuclease of the OLD family
MYISRLRIRNYRNFLNFAIDLKPLTLIIGENNVGKSNLLDSIGLIFSQEVSFFKKRMLEVADFNYLTIKDFKKKILDVNVPAEEIAFPEIEVEAILQDWDDDQEAVVADWFINKECLKHACATCLPLYLNLIKPKKLMPSDNLLRITKSK